MWVRVGLWLNIIKKMELNDITYKINGAVFEVNRVLGSGFLEKVYENALLIELRNQGLKGLGPNFAHPAMNCRAIVCRPYRALTVP